MLVLYGRCKMAESSAIGSGQTVSSDADYDEVRDAKKFDGLKRKQNDHT